MIQDGVTMGVCVCVGGGGECGGGGVTFVLASAKWVQMKNTQL